MRDSLMTGLSFGLTSGIITPIGLMVGLHSGAQPKSAIIGGILTIAIADSFSDALGIHVSEESENKHIEREIWISTLSTFVTKFVISSTFVIPIVLLELDNAVFAGIVWGVSLLGVMSYIIAAQQKANPWKAVTEHILIAAVVIMLAHLTGDLIKDRAG